MWIIGKLLKEVRDEKALAMFQCDACANHWSSLRWIEVIQLWVCSPCKEKRDKAL